MNLIFLQIHGRVNESLKKSVFAVMLGFIEQLLATLFVMSLIFTYCLRIVDIQGESMENTLRHEDRVIIGLLYNKPKAGDIVVIKPDEAVTLSDEGVPEFSEGIHKTIIKRVIACEGQTVDIDFDKGIVYVDGERLKENYVTLGMTHIDEGAFTGQYPVTVPNGYVFVMGDNRPVSMDSRSDKIGFVSEESITGRVLIRISPKMDFVE